MIKKLLILLLLCSLCSSAFGQFQQKPFLGQQIDWSNPLSKGLVAGWWFNEGTGNIVNDFSGNGNTGMCVADTHFVPGKFGPALSFDGTGDYVNCGTSSIFNITNTPLTIIAWINSTARANAVEYNIVGKGDTGGNRSYWLRVLGATTTARLRFGTIENYIYNATGVDMHDGLWHQAAGVYGGGSDYRIYKDGLQIPHAGTPSVGFENSTEPLTIGGQFDDGVLIAPYNGQIGHVLIFNRALSASEIAELYRNPFGIIQPTFSVWWYSGIGGEPPATFGQVIMISN